MRKTIQTLVLILALTGITYAGDIGQPIVPPPPTPAPSTPGDIGQPLAQTIVAIIETALSLG
jgi:hypothetical protein